MPELVSNGPRIPVQLMNKADSGDLIFFCGAGVSAGEGSGLPSFAELVDHVYNKHHIVPDPVEREALHLDARGSDLWRPQFDKVLGLLERRERLGAAALRSTVARRLSEPPDGELVAHAALITLSTTREGMRLVTTNFDKRFVEAGLDNGVVDAAPKLPVPKRYNWSGLVQLHGSIVADDDGSNLVLTAADFGRAYLTERWAARFVTELFQEFTVVFVGYSVGDPVMAYLVDALAAERAKGARIANSYAFAHHDGTDAGCRKARDGWLAKNIEPILYNCQDGHCLLTETLIEWARIRGDSLQARSHIAINDINKLPAGPNDPVVERVVWALQDPVAATALAEAPPIVDEAEFPKIEKWLKIFQQDGLLGCAAADANPGTGDHDPGFVRLVDSGLQSWNSDTLDTTRACLAHWIARHLHVPQVLAWVVRNGGHMHPFLRDKVRMQLGHAEIDIPPRLRLLWTSLSNREPIDPRRFLWICQHYQAACTEKERRRVEDQGIMSLTPRLVVLPGPSPHKRMAHYFDKKSSPIPAVDACGHMQVAVGEENSRYSAEKILVDEGVLTRHAETLTGLLERALVLRDDVEDIHANSSHYRPSIAAHEQNQHHDSGGLCHLIDLVRDSYLALASRNRARGDMLLRRWVLSGSPVFKRLALHALTENSNSDIHIAKRLLTSGRKPGVWDWELQREVLRFLRKAGTRLPRGLRAEIVRAIRAGPKSIPKKRPPNYQALIRRECALRLHKLAVSGVRLDIRSRALAEEYEPPEQGEPVERDEFVHWRGQARWIGAEEFAPRELLEGTVEDVAQAIEKEGIDLDSFRGLVAAQLKKVADALGRLAAGGKWPGQYWQRYTWSVAILPEEPISNFELQQQTGRLLADAPEWLFKELGAAAAELVRVLAKRLGTDREPEIRRLWENAWTAVDASRQAMTDSMDDPLTDALGDPAGKLADAAVFRLMKYEPGAGDRLPKPVRAYFDAIAAHPGGHYGRVMLATRLHYLFGVDPDWVAERLIPILSLENMRKTSDLWYAYGWSGIIGPNLLQALKRPFLRILREDEVGPETKHRLTVLFMTVCLEAPGELTTEEVHAVVGAMSEDALKTVLGSLRQRLRGEAAERADAWRKRVHPWLLEYWPQAEVRNTIQTSEAMLDVLADCGDAFPEAATWSLGYLRSSEGGLFHLGESGQASRYPQSVLEVLDQVVGPTVLPDHSRYALRRILDEVRTAMREVGSEPRFQRLYLIAMQ